MIGRRKTGATGILKVPAVMSIPDHPYVGVWVREGCPLVDIQELDDKHYMASVAVSEHFYSTGPFPKEYIEIVSGKIIKYKED